jgi:KaiC/GvpD/RAD55 family RecA-like ATPase
MQTPELDTDPKLFINFLIESAVSDDFERFIVVIAGGQGTGKTTLAYKIARRIQNSNPKRIILSNTRLLEDNTGYTTRNLLSTFLEQVGKIIIIDEVPEQFMPQSPPINRKELQNFFRKIAKRNDLLLIAQQEAIKNLPQAFPVVLIFFQLTFYQTFESDMKIVLENKELIRSLKTGEFIVSIKHPKLQGVWKLNTKDIK